MRIWRWTIIRTAEFESSEADWLRRVEEHRADADRLREESVQLREEIQYLSDSLDRSKYAVSAVIDQREELARQLRETKRR